MSSTEELRRIALLATDILSYLNSWRLRGASPPKKEEDFWRRLCSAIGVWLFLQGLRSIFCTSSLQSELKCQNCMTGKPGLFGTLCRVFLPFVSLWSFVKKGQWSASTLRGCCAWGLGLEEREFFLQSTWYDVVESPNSEAKDLSKPSSWLFVSHSR